MTTTTVFYANVNTGMYLGSATTAEVSDDAEPLTLPDAPANSVVVPNGPTDGRAVWAGSAWDYSGIPLIPNGTGFILAAKTALGGVAAVLASQALAAATSVCYEAVRTAQWDDVATIIITAKNVNTITADQYTALQAAAVANNIPVTLP